MQIGAEFPIFQDRNDIAWGQNWRDRVEETLDSATLLIPIITPSFFRSPPCRDEVSRFLERERQLDRRDLILPVYYVSTPEMDDPDRRAADGLAQELAERQYADWRELRFEPFTAPVVRKTLAQLASRLRDGFWQAAPVRNAVPKPSSSAKVMKQDEAAGRTADAGQEDKADQAPVAKVDPPTHVVDPYHRGNFTTISAAIEAAAPGDRILVRPGLYQEGLVINKPLELLGDGPVADIVIQARSSTSVLFRANIGRIANLTLRQAGGGKGQWFGVDITQGRLELEGCDISSQSRSCVVIRDGADPRVRRNHIHAGKHSGVFVYDDALGLLEDNDIHGNTFSEVVVRLGGNPTLRRNQIHDGMGYGVLVLDGGSGLFEDNDIHSNASGGVAIRLGGNPTLRRNQIHDGKKGGVLVSDNGLGLFEDNDIHSNALVGVEVRAGGNPTLRRNKIYNNEYEAIWIHDSGGGTVEDNDLRNNMRGSWDIEAASKKRVRRARNLEGDVTG